MTGVNSPDETMSCFWTADWRFNDEYGANKFPRKNARPYNGKM